VTDNLNDVLKPFLDQEEDRRRERLQYLEAKFKDDPESLTDRDRLELIALMPRSPEIQSAQHLEALVTQLTFVNEAIDPEDLRTAWKKFLTSLSSCDSPSLPPEWNSKCDWVMARCFEELGKRMHSVSVCEYMLSQMIGGDPDYHKYAEECLFGLFEYYFESKPSRRAREILTLITTYCENDFISDDRYYAVLPKETELFYREKGEVVDRDRHLVEERLRLELMEAFDKLHAATRIHLIDAELWSEGHMRRDEPTAGPRRWVLAIESEFHYKVFKPNREILERALQGNRPESPLRPEQSCSIGQIAGLVKKAGSGRPTDKLVAAVFGRLRGHRKFVSGQLNIPEVAPKHREKFAHVKEEGPYAQDDCDDFIRQVRASGWIYQFLLALQPD
jgi:hypothetical protein